MKLILDKEYDKLYYDEDNETYVLWLLITHVMWYDVFIRLEEAEVARFMNLDNTINDIEFRHFASEVAGARPGLIGKITPWDDRIISRNINESTP